MITVIYNESPRIGVKRPDGTQTISYLDNNGAYRTTISTPEKIDTFVKNINERAEKSEKITRRWILLPMSIGCLIGTMATAKRNSSDLDDLITILWGGTIGLGCGWLGGAIHAERLRKKFCKEYEEDIKNLEIKKVNSASVNKNLDVQS